MKASVLLLLLGVTIFASKSAPQYPDAEWRRKIILFQSTRTDVEKMLGQPIGPNYGVTYRLNDGVLYLDYYDFDHCKPRSGFEADWNLPEWTVTEIEYRPNDSPSLGSLHLDLKKFRKTHDSPEVPQLVSYINDEEGVDYTFGHDDKLNSVRFFPALAMAIFDVISDESATATISSSGFAWQQPQNSGFDLEGIKKLVNPALSNSGCAGFIRRVLNAASSRSNPVLEGGDAAKIFQDFLNQKNGGLTRERPPGSLGYGSPTGRIAKGNGTIYLRGGVANQTVVDAIGVIDELAHLAGSKESYTDQLLATIVHGIPEYAALSRMKPQNNVFDPNYNRKDEAAKNSNAGGWSSYFHDIQRQKCPVN